MGGKMTGLQIYLEGGHVIVIAVSEEQARKIVNGRYGQVPIEHYFGSCLGTGISWSVRSDKIVGAHTFDWEARQLQLALQNRAMQQQQALAPGTKLMSGPH